MSDRVIVGVKYTPVAAPGGLRKAVGAFLRYVQYRDKHSDQERPPEEAQRRVDGELRYIAHRDQAAGRARLFNAMGTVGDEERRSLAAFVTRAANTTRPQLTRSDDGSLVDRRRALYRFVISPENADSLDLRRLTGAAVSQLEADAGGEVRWIAAEHRNTAHPHVHLIVAGFRETESGTFRSLVLTKPRLQRIKEAVGLEIERQRGRELAPTRVDRRPDASLTKEPSPATQEPKRTAIRVPLLTKVASTGRSTTSSVATTRFVRHSPFLVQLRTGALRRLAARYRWEAEREAAGRQRSHEMEVA
jgi:hypothetical protein